MRKSLRPNSWLYPMPVLIVSAYDEKGVPNSMNAAWGGITNTNEVGICISYCHKTTKNILKKKCFTVACGTKDEVVACDYVGMVSGNKVKNKLEKCGFTTCRAEKVDAPIINELPFALECVVTKYDKKSELLLGKIVNINVDSKVLNKGKISIKKLQPLVFNAIDHTYHVVGDKVGNAFKDFKKIK